VGEVIEGRWGDPEDLDVFTPNCPTDLVPMEPDEDDAWRCPECGLVRID
jgi:hypothetical protein